MNDINMWNKYIAPQFSGREKCTLGEKGAISATSVKEGKIVSREVELAGRVIFEQDTVILCENFIVPSDPQEPFTPAILLGDGVEDFTIVAKTIRGHVFIKKDAPPPGNHGASGADGSPGVSGAPGHKGVDGKNAKCTPNLIRFATAGKTGYPAGRGGDGGKGGMGYAGEHGRDGVNVHIVVDKYPPGTTFEIINPGADGGAGGPGGLGAAGGQGGQGGEGGKGGDGIEQCYLDGAYGGNGGSGGNGGNGGNGGDGGAGGNGGDGGNVTIHYIDPATIPENIAHEGKGGNGGNGGPGGPAGPAGAAGAGGNPGKAGKLPKIGQPGVNGALGKPGLKGNMGSDGVKGIHGEFGKLGLKKIETRGLIVFATGALEEPESRRILKELLISD